MICDSKMVECLFDALKKCFNVYPDNELDKDWKSGWWKYHLQINQESLDCQYSFQKSIHQNAIKNTPLKKVFVLLCEEHALSHVLMTPVTTPNNCSPIKSSPCGFPTIQEDSDINELEDDNGANLNSIHNQSKE